MSLNHRPDNKVEMANDPAGAGCRVSIVIPYYNQPEFLSEAVSSARNQTHPDIEIIVIDDGSRVPATAVLQDLWGIHLLRTANRGVSAARNLGVQNSSGDYFIFLDADDRLLPGAVEAHLEKMRERPDVGLTFGSQRIIDQKGAEIRPAHICRPRRDYFRMLLEGNPIGSPGAAMMRRTAVESAGLFKESVSMGEDYDLYLRIARQFPLTQHSFCVLEYRQHGANTSLAQDKMYLSTMCVLDQIEPQLTASERNKTSLRAPALEAFLFQARDPELSSGRALLPFPGHVGSSSGLLFRWRIGKPPVIVVVP